MAKALKDGKLVDATELTDLVVDRIDGVRDPATGLKFLLFKSKDAAQRVVRKAASFTDVVFGTKPVAKSVEESMPGEGGIKPTKTSSVGAALDRWAGKPQDATRTPGAPATSGFDREGPRHGLVRALDSYQFADPWLNGQLFTDTDPGFKEGEGSGIPAAANFKPTQPGSLPNDGASLQFSKSALLWAYADAVRAGEAELAKAIKSKLEKAGVNVAKSVDNVEWLHGPARWNKK